MAGKNCVIDNQTEEKGPTTTRGGRVKDIIWKEFDDDAEKSNFVNCKHCGSSCAKKN
jgi:hypothetical protein